MSTDARYLARQVVLVGYGRVGRRVAHALAANDIPFVVAEQNRELVESLRELGMAAVFGDAVDPAVLIQAHIARAAMLVIATPDTLNVRQIITTARTLNPHIETVVRSPSADEARRLAQECDSAVFLADEALAQAMARHVLERTEARQARHTSPASLHSRV
jgi:CPA2 family monovalent cation:H+ antiporter-2